MKIALITDQHFGCKNDTVLFLKYYQKFYKNIFFPYILENNIKVVIDLGDTFDRRKYINYNTLKLTKDMWFDPLKNNDIEFHAIVGNHTSYFRNTLEVNAMDLLIKDYPNFNVYIDPKIVKFDDVPVLFVPWINMDNHISAMKLLKTAKADILMGHLSINGFEMYMGQPLQESGYDKTLFKRFDMVFSGHFHHKSDDGQIYYLGTPYEITWSDYDDPKGFHVFDTETRELERIVNPYTIYKKIYYDDVSNSYDNHDIDQYKEKYVKLVVVNKKDLYQFDKFVDKLLKTDVYEVKIAEDFSELDASNVSDDIVENAEDTMTLLERYVDELDVTLNKDKLKSKMRALYTEAQDLEF